LHGKNLHRYGIRENEFLKSVSSEGNSVDPMEKQRQLELRERLKKLEELRDNTRSTLMKKSFEGEILHLTSYLSDMEIDNQIIGVDQIAKDAEKESKTRNKLKLGNVQTLFKNFF